MIKISEILEYLPKKLILTFLILLAITIVIPYAFDYFISYNNAKIRDVNQKLDNFVKEYNTQQENYFAVLHFLAIDYLSSNKKYLSKIINNLPKYLPKSFSVEEFSYDIKENKIKLNGSLPGWLEYARVYKYFSSNNTIFPDFKIENLDFDKENSKVKLSISFSVNYQELYK